MTRKPTYDVGGAASSDGGRQMEHRLIVDIIFLDVHLQLWSLLVTAIMSLWFVYVWVTL